MYRAGSQHIVLGGAGSEAEGRRYVMAHPDSLSAVREEAADPQAGMNPQVPQLDHQFVREDGVECRAVIYEEHLHIAPLLLQVGECSMECFGHCVFCGTVRSVGRGKGCGGQGCGGQGCGAGLL